MANGLFGGPTADEVRNKLRLQQQLLNQKRIADAQSGLKGPARFAAKAAAESEQALSGISRGLMQGAGELFGIESLKRKEDPLVSKALKRDKDRTEILGILESYRNDSASPGIIDQNEMKQGFALLMSRGYPDEAKMFLEAAQKEIKGSSEQFTYGSATIIIRDSEGDMFSVSTARSKTNPDNVRSVFTPVGSHNKKKPVGKTEVVTRTMGESSSDRLARDKSRIRASGEQNRQTASFKENLVRETAKIKKDLNVEEYKAKELARVNIESREQIVDAGFKAATGLPKLKALLNLAKERKTGGNVQAAIRALGRAFNMEGQKFAEFRTGAQRLMIDNLKAIFGPRATDKDLTELAKAFARENQTYTGNISILENLVKRYEKEINNAEFFRYNPNASKADLFAYIQDGRPSSQLRPAPAPASAPQSAAPAPVSAPQLTAPGSAQPRTESAADLFNSQ